MVQLNTQCTLLKELSDRRPEEDTFKQGRTKCGAPGALAPGAT